MAQENLKDVNVIMTQSVKSLYIPMTNKSKDVEKNQDSSQAAQGTRGRPFLATANALITCRNELIKLSFGNMTFEVNIFHITKQPEDDDEGHQTYMIDSLMVRGVSIAHYFDPFEYFIVNSKFDSISNPSAIVDICAIFYRTQNYGTRAWQPKFEDFPEKGEKQIPSSVEAHKVELKPLPKGLKHAFLSLGDTFPVIISSKLSESQSEKLIQTLSEYKLALGWSIADIKGVSPLVCSHEINLEKRTNPRKDPQRRVNPIMKEVVKNEVLKLLDAGIIYPIADSKWVNALFEWTQACQEASKMLIDKLTSAPIIQPPDWTLPFEIMCDASDFAIGAFLGQRREWKSFVIYYAKFDITIKDKKGVENVVADHLSRLTFEDIFDHLPILNDFPDEHLFSTSSLPWFAYIVSYLVVGEIPVDWNAQDKRKFMTEARNFYWEDPFLFKYCPDQILRCCILGEEIASVLEFCHSQACGVDYVSKWVETIAFRSNDNRTVIKFLKENVLSRFGTPRSDRGTQFCNCSFEVLMKNYGVVHKISTACHLKTSG
ncbi:uncharacterized protein LOC131164476 [Malania oleifera]|uniref:uncharacterized protein LOC131164476 n=1 Tax=Malania oleifera TaxID=397392 RepID=UPI0025AEBA34|nr:uncharacterized protein LOC131164476 [Malania oleifera]